MILKIIKWDRLDAEFSTNQQLAIPRGKEIFTKVINRTENLGDFEEEIMARGVIILMFNEYLNFTKHPTSLLSNPNFYINLTLIYSLPENHDRYL